MTFDPDTGTGYGAILANQANKYIINLPSYSYGYAEQGSLDESNSPVQ